MDKKAVLVDALRKYREKLIIERLSYRVLNPDMALDYRTLRMIASYDENKSFFGDRERSSFGEPSEYLDYAIFFERELIGYVGYRYSHSKDLSRYMPAIIIKPKYQQIGIGDVVVKQLINTLFTEYDGTKSIYAIILQDNGASINLVEKNNFTQFKGYRENDFVYIDGKAQQTVHYLYTVKDFKRDQKRLMKYRTMKVINK